MPSFVLFLVVGIALGCDSPAQCSFNGECIAGRCVCDAEWHGERCQQLSLRPASPQAGLRGRDDRGAVSSWGATALQADDGLWHMWASEFVNNCGVAQWSTTSQIVHATASAAEGPYIRQDVVVQLWAHGPKVTRAPTGEFVMVYIHTPIAPENTTFASVCQDGRVVQRSPYENATGPAEMRSYLSWATDPNGPWSEPVALEAMYEMENPWDNADHNLVITINGDGSVSGLIRRCCQNPQVKDGWVSWIYTVRAQDWRDSTTWSSNSTPAFGTGLEAHGYEDPHIWPDARRPGVYHAVIHNMVGSNHHPQVGLHAYSDDGGVSWTSTGIAFNWTVPLSNGSDLVCLKRERPTMIFDKNGLPTHLLTACQYVDDETKTSYSLVQPLGAEANIDLI